LETQRQWSDLAIARTTPILLGFFSFTTLAAHALQKHHPTTQRPAAWYDKPSPTFVDAIALARRHLWLVSEGFSLSAVSTDTPELPATLYHQKVQVGARIVATPTGLPRRFAPRNERFEETGYA